MYCPGFQIIKTSELRMDCRWGLFHSPYFALGFRIRENLKNESPNFLIGAHTYALATEMV